MITKYRLAKVVTQQQNQDTFNILLHDNSEQADGQSTPEKSEFDTIDEAINFASTSENWNQIEFTIITIYSFKSN